MASTPPTTIKKLSSLVNKEIVKRHLDESIRHQQSRNKYRSHKLMNNFIIPSGVADDKLFLWSNAYGNGFNMVEKQFSQWIAAPPVKLIVSQMKAQINQTVYSLWAEHRQVSTSNPFHKSHTLIATISIILIGLLLVSFLLLSQLAPFFSKQALTAMEGAFPQLLIYAFMAMWVLGMIVSLIAYTRQYKQFNYDRQVVKVIVDVLGRYEQTLLKEGWIIKLDKEITCICIIKEGQKEKQRQTNKEGDGDNHNNCDEQNDNKPQVIPNIFRSFQEEEKSDT